MKIHLLSGFLGSGKTTAIQHACAYLLHQQVKVGVITNDQGTKLVDGNFFESLNIPGRQVTNGCFCCNYNDLDSSIQSLIQTNNPDIIFAEAVGSCTDMVATVLKPIQHVHKQVQVTISTFADVRLLQMMIAGSSSFDEDIQYIYHKQLEEATIIVVNKIDLIEAEELEKLKAAMQEKYGNKILLYLSVFDAGGIQQWLDALVTTTNAPASSLQINYDMYGAGEAKLAWLDEELAINSDNRKAVQNAIALINTIYQKTKLQQYAIGHLKFLINGSIKLSYTAATEPENLHFTNDQSSTVLLINARVQATPEQLNSLVKEAIKEVEIITGSQITVNSTAAFQPGYPRPTYRMAD